MPLTFVLVLGGFIEFAKRESRSWTCVLYNAKHGILSRETCDWLQAVRFWPHIILKFVIFLRYHIKLQ